MKVPARFAPLPLASIRLLLYIFFQPGLSRAAVTAADHDAILRASSWLLGTLIFLPLAIPPFAVSVGALPAPKIMSPGFLSFLLLALIAGWLATGLGGGNEWVGEESTDGRAKSAQFVPAFLIGVGVLLGATFDVAFALDGSLLRAVLVLGGLALALDVAAAIGAMIAPNRIARAATYLALLAATGTLAFQFTLLMGNNVNRAVASALELDRGAADLSSVCVFFAMLFGLMFGLWKLNQRGVEAVQRKLASHGSPQLAILFALAYVVLVWTCWFGGWQI
jgi:hypothetical protein